MRVKLVRKLHFIADRTEVRFHVTDRKAGSYHEGEKEQVPGENFVFVDAVFGMRPEQVGLQEEEDKIITP